MQGEPEGAVRLSQYDSMTVPQLKEQLQQRGVSKGLGGMRKAELLDNLKDLVSELVTMSSSLPHPSPVAKIQK